MASLFSARRKPKRITREDPRADQDDDDTGPVVRRPGTVKTKSKLRVSFNPSDADAEDSNAVHSEQDIKPTFRFGPSSTVLQDKLKHTSLREDEPSRPTYNKSYLDELRNSNPSTPQALNTPPDEDEQRILDIEAKFEKPSLNTSTTSIPSATEIAEKKARRVRLALSSHTNTNTTNESEDYIPLDSYDSDGEFKPQRMQLSTFHQPHSSRTSETRLQREDEDEDIAEGFEAFLEDNPAALKGRYETDSLQLSRRAKREASRKQRAEMRALIEHAEHSDSDSASAADGHSDAGDHADSDTDSETERRHQYNSAQTHRGLDGLASHTSHKIRERRPRQPLHTTPIVKLSVGLAGLRGQVERIAMEKKVVERRLEEVRRERGEVRERGRVVQRELEALGRSVEVLNGSGTGGGGDGVGVNGDSGTRRTENADADM